METNSGIGKLEEIMRKISEFLCTGLEQELGFPDQSVRYYWEASRKAEKLIRATLGEEGMKFPVDIFELAQRLGVNIEEEDLNMYANAGNLNRRIGQIVICKDFFANQKSETIYIDKMAAPASKRYALAHEIVHYIMHCDKDDDYYEDYCIMPMCPKRIEEIMADIFAIFLLLPVRLFFEEFEKYVWMRSLQGRTPVTTEAWIKYLGERALLSEYYVAYGYQQLRYVGYWICQAWHDEEKNEEVKMTEKEREDIKNETRSYFNSEIEELLFQ